MINLEDFTINDLCNTLLINYVHADRDKSKRYIITEDIVYGENSWVEIEFNYREEFFAYGVYALLEELAPKIVKVQDDFFKKLDDVALVFASAVYMFAWQNENRECTVEQFTKEQKIVPQIRKNPGLKLIDCNFDSRDVYHTGKRFPIDYKDFTFIDMKPKQKKNRSRLLYRG